MCKDCIDFINETLNIFTRITKNKKKSLNEYKKTIQKISIIFTGINIIVINFIISDDTKFVSKTDLKIYISILKN